MSGCRRGFALGEERGCGDRVWGRRGASEDGVTTLGLMFTLYRHSVELILGTGGGTKGAGGVSRGAAGETGADGHFGSGSGAKRACYFVRYVVQYLWNWFSVLAPWRNAAPQGRGLPFARSLL